MARIPSIVRGFLAIVVAIPALLSAQTAPQKASADSIKRDTSVLIAQPLGVTRMTGRDSVKPRKEYHGVRWTVIGAVTGGVLAGGAATYLSMVCATGGDCRGVWRFIVMAAGVGAVIGGFLTGLVYGLFNG